MVSLYKTHQKALTQSIGKGASFVLALFLLLSQSVFAQETEVVVDQNESVAGEVSTPEAGQTEIVQEAIPVSEEEPINPEGGAQMAAMSGGGANEEGYTLQTSLQTSEALNNLRVQSNTGALTYSYSLDVPQGRGLVTPVLILNYSSQNLDDGSSFGYGWGISIPYIERMNKTGIDSLYNSSSSYFASSIHGELATAGTSSAQYKAKIETGEFLTFSYTDSSWIVTDKQGTKYFYGTTSQSRQVSPSDSTKVFRWYLERMEDTNGNIATYTYSKDLGAIYPKQIQYTNSPTSTGIYTISFATSTIATSTSYTPAFKVERRYIVSTTTITANGQTVRTYNLRYTNGINERRSLLVGVTETGYENGVPTALPEEVFQYEGDQLPTWTLNNTVDFPEPLGKRDLGVRFGDMNGDGLTDIVRNYKFDGIEIRRVHINKGDGSWDIDVPWDWSDINKPFLYKIDASPDKYYDMGARLIDVNGDGKSDLVVAAGCEDECWYADPVQTQQLGVYLNTGTGFAKDLTWGTPPAFVTWNQDHHFLRNEAREFIDVNADGLPDIVTAYFDSYSNGSPQANLTSSVLINTGSGWVSSNWSFPAAFGPASYGTPIKRQFTDMGTRIADVNGDGLIDVLRGYRTDASLSNPDPDRDEKNVYLNTGSGWATTSIYSLPVEFIIPDYPQVSQGYDVLDINGDNLPEIYRAYYFDNQNSYTYEYYLNDGRGWTSKTYTAPFVTTSEYLGYSTGKAFIDFDGDTLVDAWDLNYTDQLATQTSAGDVYTNNGNIPDRLTQITESNGGVITVRYDGYLDTKQSTYTLIGTTTYNPVVASVINYDSGFSNAWSTLYDYQKGYFTYSSSSLRDRKFAGFESVTRTSSSSKEITRYHQGDSNNTSYNELSDSYLKIGLPYRVDVTDLSGNVYKQKVSKWDTNTTATNTGYVYTSRELIRSYDGDGDTKDSGTEQVFNTSNGNLSQQIDWGEVSGNTDGSFSDTGTDKRITQYGYATNTTDYIVGLPSSEVILDQSGNKVRESRYYYDSSALGTVTKGNRTKEEGWITGSTYASGTKVYNSYGLVTSETDPRGKTTTYAYDTYNLYPATSTNPQSHSTKYTYDYSSGKVATTTDPNGEVSVVVYDGLDRPRLERGSDPQTGTLVTKNEYVYTDTPGSVSVKKTSYLNGATTSTAYVYQDGFGRTIQERKEVEDSNTYAVKDYVYGQDGLLTKESLPYTSTGASSTASTSVTNLYTLYAYDALGRVKSATTSVGTTRTSRDQWTETVTDALGKVKDYVYDAYGRLSQVKEYNSTSTYTTTYTWDHNNNLTKITDALGNVRNITYDGLGRRLTLEDLHNPSDTSFSSWTFTYDLAGNLSTTTNPKGQVIGYSYDSLNRPLTENFTGQAGTEVTYSYDSCTEGVGRLCIAVNSGATTTYTYTNTGAPKTEVKTIGGTAYTTAFEYDYQGNQTLVTYPDSSVVRYTYNKGNQLERVEQKESGGSYRNIITDFDYGPHGMVTYQLHGNGASTTKTYNADALYRLTRILTTASSTYGTGGPGDELFLLETELGLADEQLTPLTTEEALVTEAVTVPEETAIQVSESTTTEEVLVNSPSQEVTPTTTEVVGTTTEETLPVTVEEATAPLATTTEEVTPTTTPISEALATTTDMVEVLVNKVVATTTELVPEELKPTKRETEKLITSSHEARVWKKFHEERVAGLRNTKDAPEGALESALYAQDQFESFLLEKGYTKAKGEKVKTSAQEFILNAIKTVVDEVVSFILPDFAYAYLFGKEDFESCSSLPCSFSTHATWGSVTGSLDNTGKAVGQDSYKTIVSGEGSASLESVNYNRDEIWVQFKVFIPSNITWGASDYFSMLRLEDSSNGTIFWLSVENWGTARLTMSGDTLSWTDTGLNLTKGATNTVEVRFKKGASTGDVDIWLNNTTQGSPSYNGSGTLNTGTDNVDDVLIGMQYAPETGISTLYFDDMTIDSAFIGTASGGGGGPTGSFVEKVQDLSYTYDGVGNITQIVDRSSTLSQATTSYEYDDLYRLTRASTTQASTTPYLRTYTYNALGNIMTSSDLGAYTYGGDTGGGGESIYAIYGDSVTAGWSDWSWWVSLNPSNASPVAVGTYSLKVTYSGAWAGMAYHTSSFDSSPYDTLRFRVNVATSTATDLYVYFLDSLGAPIQVVTLESYIPGGFQANTWHTVEIPLSDLDFENYSGATDLAIEVSGASVIYYDQIELVGTGGGSSNYANPHAVTAINGVTYSYDTNGNLASTTAGLTNTWDYLNRLTQSQGGGTATTTYSYDHIGQRTQKVANSITTKYPNQYYEVKGSTTTKHIYAGDALVATVQSDTPAPMVYHNHLDHLGSTNVTTDEDSYLNSVFSYYPYGDTRVDTQYGELPQSRQYVGTELDTSSGYNYMSARYADTREGRFISQDPVFWEIGITNDGLKILSNPQYQNSYSYAGDNPIGFKDSSGRYPRSSISGYSGFKGMGLQIVEDMGGILRAHLNIYSNLKTINDYKNADLIKAIIFEEQVHGLEDTITDTSIGNTIGLGQIRINDERAELGYGSYTREELLDPTVNIREINSRVNSISQQLNELGISSTNENYIAYIASAYNSQDWLGEITDYGLRVQSYYKDASSGKAILPDSLGKTLLDKAIKKKDE